MNLETKERAQTELALIAAIADDPKRVEYAAGRISGSDFFLPVHAKAFNLVVRLREQGKPINDSVFLLDQFSQAGVVGEDGSQIGGQEFREAMFDAVPSNVPEYCEQIIRWSTAHGERELSKKIVDWINDPEVDSLDALNLIREKIDALADRTALSAKPLAEYAREYTRELRENLQAEKERGLPTGISQIDQLIGGLVPGELIVVGARPGNGKTTLATQFLRNVARKGMRGLLVSLEMEGRDLAQRVLCADAEVRLHDIRSGGITEDMIERLEAVVDGSQKENPRVEVLYGESVTVKQIRSVALTMKNRSELHLLAIDYLSLIKQEDPKEFRAVSVSKIIKEIREIAKDLSIPVVVLCQLNRNAGDEGALPRMAHLRESGAIEEVADLVMLLHNPRKVGGKHVHPELYIEKARQASTGKILLIWNSVKWMFEDRSSDMPTARSTDVVEDSIYDEPDPEEVPY